LIVKQRGRQPFLQVVMSKNVKKKKIEPQTTRRGFLNKIWMGLGVVVVAEIIGLVIAFLHPRKPRVKAGEFGTIITAGPIDNFALNSVTTFQRGQFYLSRLDDGGFLALSRKCTHLGCTVPWVASEQKFTCPCHKSIYDNRGDVISPPAPRALDLFAVMVENEIVKVDTGQLIKRGKFRNEQVTYPAKSSK
jgi:cytochrome b6-f complex iron-sulfur subunit